jgi:hypothetical protein
MSHSTICLNCDSNIINKFCSQCGQKTDTHRITFRHFIFHDILHGVWHFEKGILFTLKEAFIRPGKAALDYISGKRIRYYNVFYLILLVIGLNLFMNSYYDSVSHAYLGTTEQTATGAGKSAGDFLTHYSKLLIFSFVPLFAIDSFVIFRRKKLNLSEHFIIAGMVFLGVMIIVTVTNLLFFLDFVEHMDFISDSVNLLTPLLILAFISFSYYKAFRDAYTRFRTLLKCCSFLIFLFFELLIIIFIFVGYFSHWTYNLELGTVK